jgi:CrcB protein
MSSPLNILMVALGGALGAVLRYGVSTSLRGILGAFPLGTLVVNVVGSILIGLVIAWASARGGEAVALRNFLQVGLLGGLTTFSSFSAETLLLLQGGRTGLALANVVLNLVLALAACGVGLSLGRAIW